MNGNVRKKSEDVVFTASRLRKWWLIRFHGYRLDGQKLSPVVTFCGAIQMAPHWTLSAPEILQDDA
jgi:hypothetical protein